MWHQCQFSPLGAYDVNPGKAEGMIHAVRCLVTSCASRIHLDKAVEASGAAWPKELLLLVAVPQGSERNGPVAHVEVAF